MSNRILNVEVRTHRVNFAEAEIWVLVTAERVTTFLPARISTTSSVGISTSPTLSCRPYALTRSSSDSFTLFSKPE